MSNSSLPDLDMVEVSTDFRKTVLLGMFTKKISDGCGLVIGLTIIHQCLAFPTPFLPELLQVYLVESLNFLLQVRNSSIIIENTPEQYDICLSS